MAVDIVIPEAGESITSANVAQWHKENGAQVSKGDILVTLETDKVSNELEASADGVLHIIVQEGEEVDIGTVIGRLDESAAAAPADTAIPAPAAESPAASPAPTASAASSETIDIVVPAAGESINSASIGSWHKADGSQVNKGDVLVTLETDKVSNDLEAEASGTLSISAQEGDEVDIGAVIGSIAVGASAPASSSSSTPAPSAAPKASAPAPAAQKSPTPQQAAPAKADFSITPSAPEVTGNEVSDGRTTRKKMSMLRRKIASHLTNAQQTAAILTTFNECDMSAIMQLRKDVQEDFIAKHGVKLGFMSFFVKATVQALKDVPSINGMIDGTDIVQNHFYDIGVAIGTEKGLIVPVIRDCDKKTFAEIEQDIIDYAMKAKEGKISMEDLQGGVFTISNGGVYGSLLSTPILNPPQSGILGMHTIQQRPIAVNKEVVIRPMMNLAMSYDHRLVDGKEAVTFLIRIKDCIENPTRLMLEM